MPVRACFHYGIVVRQTALASSGVSRETLLSAMEAATPFSEDEELIVFGPSFGSEACDERIRRLKDLGLEYFDDFFELQLDHPSWLAFDARLAATPLGQPGQPGEA